MRVRMAAVLVLAAATASAQPAPPAPQPPAASPAEPAQSTETLGAVPDLGGRWLVLLRLGAATDAPVTTSVRFWDVRSADGAQRLDDRAVTLPPAMAERQKAAGASWAPTADDLRTLAASWDDLPREERGVARIKTELIGAERFDADLRGDAATSGAAWAVRQLEEFVRGGGRPVSQALVVGVHEPTAAGYRGMVRLVMLAMAPFPVPIALRGHAELYRLDARPGGLLARVLGVFAGCGRRP